MAHSHCWCHHRKNEIKLITEHDCKVWTELNRSLLALIQVYNATGRVSGPVLNDRGLNVVHQMTSTSVEKHKRAGAIIQSI